MDQPAVHLPERGLIMVSRLAVRLTKRLHVDLQRVTTSSCS
jgi:hypothetical protein